MLQRFNENRWQPLTAFPLKVLGDVSISGNGTGIAASSHGVVLRRGLQFQICRNILNQFFLTIPGIFGSALVNVYVTYRQQTVNIRPPYILA